MRNTSFGGRARCGCRCVPGNVGVGTSPSAGPRALQPGGQRARMAPRRAPRVRKLPGSARPAFPAPDGPAGAAGAARFAAERAERRGSLHMAAAVGAAAASRPGGRSSSISISMMSPVQTPRCALFSPTARLCVSVFLLARPREGFSADPEPATPYPCRVGRCGPDAARGCGTCCGGACVWLLRPGSYSGWRVPTVADGHVGAAEGGGARILGVVSGWPCGWRRVEAAAPPQDPGWMSGAGGSRVMA
eukprot:scaffold18419_cov98-Isochrysis_galbana.AAC.3